MLNTVTMKNREAWNIHIPQFLGMAEPWGARVLLWRPSVGLQGSLGLGSEVT